MTTYNITPALFRTESGAYAFDAEGTEILWPVASPCGRFQCTPEAYGFTVYGTGGNCTAWRRDFTLHGSPVYMLLTQADEPRHEISDDDGAIGVGVYAFDGDCFVNWTVSQAEAGYDVLNVTAQGRMPPSAEELARTFARIVRETLTPDELDTVNARNATPEYVGCCATHDFADANMLMRAAWCELCGWDEDRASVDEVTDSPNDWALACWNAAWEMARAAGFYRLSAQPSDYLLPPTKG